MKTYLIVKSYVKGCQVWDLIAPEQIEEYCDKSGPKARVVGTFVAISNDDAKSQYNDVMRDYHTEEAPSWIVKDGDWPQLEDFSKNVSLI